MEISARTLTLPKNRCPISASQSNRTQLISSCLRQVPPPCQPSALGGIFSNDDGDDDDGDGDDDDDCDGDDDDDDEEGEEEEEEEGCHMWRFSFLPR